MDLCGNKILSVDFFQCFLSLVTGLVAIDGAPVWHVFVSRWGAVVYRLEIQTKWPPFILFIPARSEFSLVYIFLTPPQTLTLNA